MAWGWSWGVGEQVPTWPTMAQLRQAELQATLQQTPSAQWPEEHSESAWQEAPNIFGPQLPSLQVWPFTQSVSTEQVGKQALVELLQEKGAHTVDAAGLQVPFPSH